MNVFGEAPRAERVKADLSQGDVASLVGVGQPTLSHWELGNIKPVRENLDKLIELFPALSNLRPTCRDMAKPAGNPNGNPGQRNEDVRRNMSEARKTAAPRVESTLRLVSSNDEESVPEHKETVEELICRLTRERDEARRERDYAIGVIERASVVLGMFNAEAQEKAS